MDRFHVFITAARTWEGVKQQAKERQKKSKEEAAKAKDETQILRVEKESLKGRLHFYMEKKAKGKTKIRRLRTKNDKLTTDLKLA